MKPIEGISSDGFDRINQRSHILDMRPFVHGAVVAFLCFWALGASWATPPPDPAGEHVYRTHLLTSMIPLAIVFGALVIACLMAKAHRKTKNASRSQGAHRDPPQEHDCLGC
jgi:hypothetical protein